jgi:hypothetical protein
MRESDLQGASITTAAAIPAILRGCSPYSGLSVGEYVDVSADLISQLENARMVVWLIL